MSFFNSWYFYLSSATVATSIGLQLFYVFILRKPSKNPIIQAQADIQAGLKPAGWIPNVRKFHGADEQTWNLKLNNLDEKDGTNDKIMDIIQESTKKSGYLLQPLKVSQTGFILDAYVITRLIGWLDVITLKICFNKGTELLNNDKKEIKIIANSESTGFIPLIIPFAPILNILFCWVPFLDGRKNNTRYLKRIRKNIEQLL